MDAVQSSLIALQMKELKRDVEQNEMFKKVNRKRKSSKKKRKKKRKKKKIKPTVMNQGHQYVESIQTNRSEQRQMLKSFISAQNTPIKAESKSEERESDIDLVKDSSPKNDTNSDQLTELIADVEASQTEFVNNCFRVDDALRVKEEKEFDENMKKIGKKHQKLYQKREQKYFIDSECTFQPRVNPLPSMYKLDTDLCKDKDKNESFIERQKQYADELNKKIEYERTQCQLQQEEECTFAPKISTYDEGGKRRSTFWQNLTSLKKKMIMQAIKDQKATEFEINHTFQPQMNEISQKILRESTTPRRRSKQCLKKHIHQEANNKEKDEMEECTFKPRITEYDFDSERYKRYAKKNVVQRLERASSLRSIQRKKKPTSSYLDQAQWEKEQRQKQNDFMMRMKYKSAEKKKKMEMLNRLYQPSFSPRISEKSKRIVKRTKSTFEDRRSQNISRRQQHLDELRRKSRQKEKKRSMVNSKSLKMLKNIKRDGTGNSRKKYYFYQNKNEKKEKIYENKKILNAWKVKKYLSMDPAQRLSRAHNILQKKVNYAGREAEEQQEVEDMAIYENRRRMSRNDMKQFFEKQDERQKVRVARMKKLRREQEEMEREQELDAMRDWNKDLNDVPQSEEYVYSQTETQSEEEDLNWNPNVN